MVVVGTPAKLGEMLLGSSRLGVYTDKFDVQLDKGFRDFKRGIGNTSVARESPSGWREPVYTYYDVRGRLTPRGVESTYLPAGVVIKNAAVFVTLDYMEYNNQLWDPLTNKFYGIIEDPMEVDEPECGGFAYRVCQLSRLFFYGRSDV